MCTLNQNAVMAYLIYAQYVGLLRPTRAHCGIIIANIRVREKSRRLYMHVRNTRIVGMMVVGLFIE